MTPVYFQSIRSSNLVSPVVLLLLTLFSITPAAAAETSSIKLTKAEKPPAIDGILSDDEWTGAVRVELPHQIYPTDKVPATEKTEAFIFYDREFLYLAFHCFDSEPSLVRAPISKRDGIDADDYVTVFLDTYHDRQRAYYMSVSAAGIQQDGIFSAGSADLTWDGIYEAKAKTTIDGYITEMAIPFKTMRFQAGPNAVWGVHFRRWIARKGERTSWARVSLDNSSLLAQSGDVTGLDDVFSGRTLDVIPTVSLATTETREPNPALPEGAGLKRVNRIIPGATVIYSVTPNATITATVNPDFSQVEADVPQLSVNQRFPLLFPERRPFFLEGSEFFKQVSGLGFKLLDTRQIVDPDWGLKFTGKFGRNTLSYLAASDNAAGLRVSTDDEAYGKNALFNTFRYQRDILKDSAVGVFVTDRRFGGSSNTVVSGEGLIRLSDVDSINLQLVETKTTSRDGTKTRGFAHNLRYSHFSRGLRIFGWSEFVQPNYRAQSGFIDRTNYQNNGTEVGYVWRTKEKSKLNKWLIYVWPYAVASRSRTLDGRPEVSTYYPAIDFQFRREVFVAYDYKVQHEGFADRVFNFRRQNVFWASDALRVVTFSGNYRWGEGINFNPQNPVIGRYLDYSFQATLKPFAALNSEFLVLKSRLRDRQTDAELFNQDIFRNRTTYQFNRFHSFRSILEYDTRQRSFGTSLLYAFVPSPNNSFFFGYNDLIFNRVDPLTGAPADGFVRQTRGFFAKVSYNFRF